MGWGTTVAFFWGGRGGRGGGWGVFSACQREGGSGEGGGGEKGRYWGGAGYLKKKKNNYMRSWSSGSSIPISTTLVFCSDYSYTDPFFSLLRFYFHPCDSIYSVCDRFSFFVSHT